MNRWGLSLDYTLQWGTFPSTLEARLVGVPEGMNEEYFLLSLFFGISMWQASMKSFMSDVTLKIIAETIILIICCLLFI